MLRRRLSLFLAATVFCVCAGVTLAAHEVTYKGTVVSASRITDGKMTVQVSVVDAKTKKPSTMKFIVDKYTKVLRGDTLVPFDQARIAKNEKIAVTINDDEEGDGAVVVRLDQKK